MAKHSGGVAQKKLGLSFTPALFTVIAVAGKLTSNVRDFRLIQTPSMLPMASRDTTSISTERKPKWKSCFDSAVMSPSSPRRLDKRAHRKLGSGTPTSLNRSPIAEPESAVIAEQAIFRSSGAPPVKSLRMFRAFW